MSEIAAQNRRAEPAGEWKGESAENLIDCARLCREAIERHPTWIDSTDLVTAHAHASVLEQDLPHFLAARPGVDEVERVARIIDPESWRIHDDLRVAEAKYAGTKIKARHFGANADQMVSTSLAKARAILGIDR